MFDHKHRHTHTHKTYIRDVPAYRQYCPNTCPHIALQSEDGNNNQWKEGKERRAQSMLVRNTTVIVHLSAWSSCNEL